MVRTYVRTTDRGRYGTEKLQEALGKLENGQSLKSVSREFGVPRQVLRRHRDNKVTSPGEVRLGRYIVSLN